MYSLKLFKFQDLNLLQIFYSAFLQLFSRVLNEESQAIAEQVGATFQFVFIDVSGYKIRMFYYYQILSVKIEEIKERNAFCSLFCRINTYLQETNDTYKMKLSSCKIDYRSLSKPPQIYQLFYLFFLQPLVELHI